jgi:hypothetical protein
LNLKLGFPKGTNSNEKNLMAKKRLASGLFPDANLSE